MWVTFVYTKLNFPHPLLVLTLFLCFSQIKISLMQKSAVEYVTTLIFCIL